MWVVLVSLLKAVSLVGSHICFWLRSAIFPPAVIMGARSGRGGVAILGCARVAVESRIACGESYMFLAEVRYIPTSGHNGCP